MQQARARAGVLARCIARHLEQVDDDDDDGHRDREAALFVIAETLLLVNHALRKK